MSNIAAVPQGRALYVLDEPTIGLHMADVEKLVRVLHRLVDAGNTVVVIEHNLDVVAEADVGDRPRPRRRGRRREGRRFAGTPGDVGRTPRSHTARGLAQLQARAGGDTDLTAAGSDARHGYCLLLIPYSLVTNPAPVAFSLAHGFVSGRSGHLLATSRCLRVCAAPASSRMVAPRRVPTGGQI